VLIQVTKVLNPEFKMKTPLHDKLLLRNYTNECINEFEMMVDIRTLKIGNFTCSTSVDNNNVMANVEPKIQEVNSILWFFRDLWHHLFNSAVQMTSYEAMNFLLDQRYHVSKFIHLDLLYKN
jgi:hypothetical protein